MTIAQDLASDVNVNRRLYLKIDGIKDVFWQDSSPVDDSTSLPVVGDAPPGAHPLLPNTIALWRFDEWAVTANVADSSPNGYSLTQNGSPGVITQISATAARLGNARGGNFDGTIYFFRNTPEATFRPQRFTIASWVYVANTVQVANSGIIDYKQVTANISNYRLGWDTSGAARPEFELDTTDGNNRIAGAATLAVGWHHLVATWDGATMRLYGDGVQLNSSQPNGGAETTVDYAVGQTFYVGIGGHTGYLDGYIDDTAIYPYALGAEWVRRTYLGGNAWSRPGLACLRPPKEASIGVDLREMSVSQSGMTFELSNIEDPSDPGKYYFAKLFAPGRYESASQERTWLRRNAASATQVDTNATSLYTNNNLSGWTASGEGFVGRETFSYTAKTTATGPSPENETLGRFTGVTKGLYPCIGSASALWGYCYRFADIGTDRLGGDQSSNFTVATVPYSLLGRRVALYVTTWDRGTRYYQVETESVLLWTGYLSDRIRFSPQNNVWQLSCTSVLEVLGKKKIADQLATANLRGINLRGTGASWISAVARRYKPDGFGSTDVTTYQFSKQLAPALYTHYSGLLNNLIDALNKSANWTATQPALTFSWRKDEDGRIVIVISCWDETADYTFTFNGFASVKLSPKPVPIYVMSALGFGVEGLEEGVYNVRDRRFVNIIGSRETVELVANTPPFEDFHPLDTIANGLRLYVDVDSDVSFAADQGDDRSARAAVAVGNVVFWIDGAVAGGGGTPAYLTLTGEDKLDLYGELPRNLVFGKPIGGKPVRIKQVYYVHGKNVDIGSQSVAARGPLETILGPLLSTGTTNYNGTAYDKIPIELGALAIQDDIVDTQSFIDIDKSIMSAYQELGARSGTFISRPLGWIDLWQQEAKLFNLLLVWRNGKITARRAYRLNIQEQTQTLSDSTNAQSIEWPEPELSLDNVVNEFEYKLDYDWVEDKFKRTITINDVDSILSLGMSSRRTIAHRTLQLADVDIDALLREYVKEAAGLSRYPWQRINVTLAPTLVNLVFVGDIVKYTSGIHPDPYGSGQMSTTAYGIITDLAWDYTSWTGRATIYLNTAYDSTRQRPWACSAVTNISAPNGGWSVATYRLTLNPLTYGQSGDTDDGGRFAVGDKVKIRERSADQASVTGPWSATVNSAYETDGANILTLNTVTLTGFDSTREYIVVPDDYATATTDQQSTEAYLADQASISLGSGDQPHKYT